MRRRLIICGVLVLWASTASAQVLTPLPVSGSLVSANDAVTGAPGSSSSIAIQLTGTWTGTVTFRASGNGGQTYVDVLGTSVTTGATSTTTTANGMFVFANGGYDAIRAVFTTATSGTVLVSMDRGYAQAKIASPVFSSVAFNAFAFSAIATSLTANGQIGFCSDCNIANPCTGGGTGAIAKRLNGVNVCN